MKKVEQRIISMFLVILLLATQLLFLGTEVMATTSELEKQDSKTNNSNIEFNAYFEGGTHSKVFDISKDEAKIYLSLKVKNAGYLNSGVIKFNNANFEIDSNNLQNKYIKSASENEIILNQINNSSEEIILEVPIKILNKDSVASDIFSKQTEVQFTAEYINEGGNSKNIAKNINVEAQWTAEAEIETKAEVSKYLPYHIGEEYGVMLQVKVQSNVKDNLLPVKENMLELNVPEINSVKPEVVNVIVNNTKATNGKENGTEFSSNNYSLNSETLAIKVENASNEAGEIAWKKNATDEYLITYIYKGQEVYNYVQENSISGDINIKNTMTLYNNEETVKAIEGTAKYELKNTVGENVGFEITSTETLSKGYIYANYDKTEKQNQKQNIEEKQETIYSVKYNMIVDYAELMDSLELNTIEEKFISQDGNEYSSVISGNKYIYNKEIKISELVFKKLLGEEGKIEILDENNQKIAEINKDTSKDDNGNYVLNIADKNTNKITIKTSKPITEGNIEIEIIKAIKPDQDYSKTQMKDFSSIKIETQVKSVFGENTKTNNIKLEEPVTKAEITVNERGKNLSTVVENKDVEIRAILDTSSLNNALYKNPVIEIELPDYIEKIDVKSVNMLFTDELKIKEAKLITENGHKTIRIVLEGTQTKYSIDEDIKGINIVINANITANKLTPSHKAEIKMYYTNENTNSLARSQNRQVATTEINFVSPVGIVAANTMTGFNNDGDELTSVENEKLEGKIEVNTSEKIATIKGNIINNYQNAIDGVSILGRIPSKGNTKIDSDEDLGSTFDTILNSAIQVSGVDSSNVKVYYSANKNATKDLQDDQNGWTENTDNLSNMYSYLIVLENYEMSASQSIEFSYTVRIPANIEFNNSVYQMYKIYYNNKSDVGTIAETKESPVLGLTTGKGPVLNATFTSDFEKNATVREGQIIEMTVQIKNDGTMDANNVMITIPQPENAEHVNYSSGTGFFTASSQNKVIVVDKIAPGETYTTSYYIKAEDLIKSELPATLKNKVTISSNESENEITFEDYNFTIEEGKLTMQVYDLVTDAVVLEPGDAVKQTFRIESITGGRTNNLKVTIPLGNGFKYKNVTARENEFSEELQIQAQYNEQTNTVEVTIPDAPTNVCVFLETEVADVEGEITLRGQVQIEGDSIVHYSNTRKYQVAKANLIVSELETSKRYVKELETFSYSFAIKNDSEAYAGDVVITDSLPDGVEFVDLTFEMHGEKNTVRKLEDGKVVAHVALDAGEEIEFQLRVKASLLPNEDDKTIENKVQVSYSNNNYETNTVTNIIEYDENAHNGNTDTPGVDSKYRITGTAWNDANKNGERESEEELLSGIEVILVHKSNNNIATNPDNNQEFRTTTDSRGQYEFRNVPRGEYLVVFLYDVARYDITEYRKDGADETLNSDAISMSMNIDGQNRTVGVSDTIKVTNGNVRDIDIGLYVSEKFDLKLDKYITKITLTTPTIGTKTYNYDDKQSVKTEVLARNMGQSSMVIEYKIVITNEGAIPGYARKIVDYLPEDVNFSTELNRDWYLSENGNIYNASLADTIINPGETKELTLVLTKQINSTGLLSNSAEIYESYNEQGMPDMDSTEANKLESEDDYSKADILISVVTGGEIAMYTGLIVIVIAMLGVGIFIIKKKVLPKKI